MFPRLHTTRPPAAGATRWPWASWARWPGAEATGTRPAASRCSAPASTGGSSSAARTPTELCCDNYNSLLIYLLSCIFIDLLLNKLLLVLQLSFYMYRKCFIKWFSQAKSSRSCLADFIRPSDLTSSASIPIPKSLKCHQFSTFLVSTKITG